VQTDRATFQNDVHECDVCGKIFETKALIFRHMKEHALWEPVAASNIKLEEEDEISHPNEESNKHQFRHQGQKRISKKKSDFGESSQVRKVSKTAHTNIRYFECLQCLKKFTRNDTLKRHIQRIHSSERNYHCSKCLKTFKTNIDRGRHERKHCKLKLL
jgi:uncharacterized Zn-finger protein